VINVLVGNLFESKAQTLVNAVNCVGIMGRGIAFQFKQRFPEMYADYAKRCEQHLVKLGQPYLFSPLFPPWILNFPTKEHWRSHTKLDSIHQGLEYLLGSYQARGFTSLAVPALGCGEGQLEWDEVGPILYGYLKQMNIPIDLYAPLGTQSGLRLEIAAQHGNADLRRQLILSA